MQQALIQDELEKAAQAPAPSTTLTGRGAAVWDSEDPDGAKAGEFG